LIDIDDFKDKRIHFIAIGGSSMSGLAEILHSWGYKYISGSDNAEAKPLPRLRGMGMKVTVGHSVENIKGADLCVHSAAIAPTNCEYKYAAENNIPILTRAELLGQISDRYSNCISIAGTHGKTTTTSMISQIFYMANTAPTIHIGGILPIIGSNVHVGDDKYFITEACEYVDSFLCLNPTCAIVLNIDSDHLDYFINLENIYKSFLKFVEPIPADGYLIGCLDDPLTAKLMQECGKRCINYGFSLKADYYAKEIEFNEKGFPRYNMYHNGKLLARVELSIVGKLNILNSMAAIICALEHSIPIEKAIEALKCFRGAGRRFEDRGICNGARVVHDYGHHPQEVAATIIAALPIERKRLWLVYQPALFSRTKAQFERLVDCFIGADKVIIIDIYGSREPFDETIHSKMLVDKIVKKHHMDCIYIPTMQEAAEYLKQHLEAGDLCLTMGSGTVDKLDGFIFN